MPDVEIAIIPHLCTLQLLKTNDRHALYKIKYTSQ